MTSPVDLLTAVTLERARRDAQPMIELWIFSDREIEAFTTMTPAEFDRLAYQALIPVAPTFPETLDAARCWLSGRGLFTPSDDQLAACAGRVALDPSASANARAFAAHRLAQMGRPSPWPTPALEPIDEPAELVPAPASGAVEVASRGPLPRNVIPIWTH